MMSYGKQLECIKMIFFSFLKFKKLPKKIESVPVADVVHLNNFGVFYHFTGVRHQGSHEIHDDIGDKYLTLVYHRGP